MNVIIIFVWIPCIFIVHCLLYVPTNAHVYIKILNCITSASLYVCRRIFFLVEPLLFLCGYHAFLLFIIYYL